MADSSVSRPCRDAAIRLPEAGAQWVWPNPAATGLDDIDRLLRG
jgi:hypothetical protein